MTIKYFTTTALALAFLTACSQAENAAQKAGDKAAEAATSVAEKVSENADAMAEAVSETAKNMKTQMPGVDIGEAVAGQYVSENTHAYITFQYTHQGYSRPTLRWNDFDANLTLDTENPEQSQLSVTIDAASIDSGVASFDDHLKSADFFNVEAFPKITFTSTDLNQSILGTGKVTGDLTMKGITKPITLNVKLNKIGEARRSGKPMLGVSATTDLKRSDWDLGLYAPSVGDDVEISIEVEFVKAE